MDEEAQALIDYYANLLIIQYNNKPKAQAHIKAIIEEIVASNIYNEVQDAYSIETAVGTQLDVLGVYADIDRFFTTDEYIDAYFGFEDATDLGNLQNNIVGFDDATNPTKTGFFLDALEVIINNFKLTDSAFRTLIKLRIAQNYGNYSLEDITQGIGQFFGTDIIIKDNYNMTMSYLIANTSAALVRAMLQKDVLQKPAGVGLEIIDGNSFYGYADATKLPLIPAYIKGFNDAIAGFTKEGGFLNAIDDIITQ